MHPIDSVRVDDHDTIDAIVLALVLALVLVLVADAVLDDLINK